MAPRVLQVVQVIYRYAYFLGQLLRTEPTGPLQVQQVPDDPVLGYQFLVNGSQFRVLKLLGQEIVELSFYEAIERQNQTYPWQSPCCQRPAEGLLNSPEHT